jgi:hypothetical protein
MFVTKGASLAVKNAALREHNNFKRIPSLRFVT